MKITVHIERLVLDGVPVGPGGTRGLQAAFETELGRLLADGGLGETLENGGTARRLDAGAVRVSVGRNAGELGTAIARSVHGGLKPERR